MRELIGRERHPSALGRPGAAVWPEIWPEFHEQIDQVMQGSGGSISKEICYRISRDGALQETWWDASFSPIDDPASPEGIGGVLVLSTDVTARRGSREAMAVHRQRLLSMFENSASFLAMAEGPEHRFVLTNKSYLALVGRENVLGLTVREALPEVVGQGLIEVLDRVYATGEPFVAEDLSLVLHRDQDGLPEVRRVNFVYHRLNDELGEPVGIVAEGHDVTEIMARKDALRAANQALSAILEYSPGLICAVTEAGQIKLISSSCRTILGYSPEDLVGKSLIQLVHLDDRDGAGAMLIEHIPAQGSVLQYDCRLTRRDGTLAAMRWAAVHSPELKTIYAVGRDVTEELERERQLRHAQKLEAIGRITAGVAHDFNNLLTVTTIAAETIVAGSSHDAGQTAQAELILGAAERGAQLVKRLLAFSRRQSLSPQPVDAGALLVGLKPLIDPALGDAVRLTLEIEQHAALICLVDFAQLEAAIFNLCVNARDAMPKGGTITISVQEKELGSAEAQELGLQPGEYVAITVADTGHGMSPDVLERAIEPFFTTKADRDGTGLGLSMVYGFAKQSGGQFTISSGTDEGTVVLIHLPRGAALEPTDPPIPLAAPGGRAHILVVDDDESVRVVVVGCLQGLGYRVSSAADGPTAVDLIGRDATIDLLLTDVEMPGGMNGRQLAEHSRLLRPDMGVLFTSGYTEEDLVSQGGLPDAGWAYLQKPYRRARLAFTVVTLLGQSP